MQHSNTWLSDSWNALSNPFAVHCVHFYYQPCFIVPNSQISSGSHSLSMIFVISLVCLSSACWDEVGKGHRCSRSRGLADQTTTLVSPGWKAMVTWARKLSLCSSRFVLSTFIPEQTCLLSLSGSWCRSCSPHICSGVQHTAGMEVRHGAWSGIKLGCSELIHQNF